ncbi:hypothetical protein ABZW49_20215 [Nonomuraea wenchangensis]
MSNSITSATQPATRPCQPWCVNHDAAGDVCHAEEISGTGLTHHASEGARIHLDDECLSPEEAAERARAIFAQVEKTREKTRLTFEDLYPEWTEAAENKGRVAAIAAKCEYLSEMEANAREQISDEPALWLASDPCPGWCTNARLHKTSDHPDDRAHDGATVTVPLLSMPVVPMTFADGPRWTAPELRLQLVKEYREVEPRVSINDGGDQVRLYATLDELERIGNAMLDLVRQGRGQGWPNVPLVPLQHGAAECDDVTCKCHEHPSFAADSER